MIRTKYYKFCLHSYFSKIKKTTFNESYKYGNCQVNVPYTLSIWVSELFLFTLAILRDFLNNDIQQVILNENQRYFVPLLV